MDLVPVATQQSDVEVPSVDIALQRALWEEARMRNQRKLEDEKWLDTFKKKVRREVGVGTDFKDGDTLIAGYHWTDGFKEAQFRDENPDMYKHYVTLQVVEQFDQDRFRKENPQMWELYRTPSFRFK